LVVFFLILYIYLFFKLKSMHHLDFNLYPNYLFIYFHQLLWAGSFTFGFCILYYCTHRPLRLTVIRELKTFIYCSNWNSNLMCVCWQKDRGYNCNCSFM
jgi:hypothetical protein